MATERNTKSLSSASELDHQETHRFSFRGKKKGKGKFFKSNSLDFDGFLDPKSHLSDRPQKPHPLRSPMRSFFRNNTIPRSVKPDQQTTESEKFDHKQLSISPDGSAWTLEDDVPTLELSTVDGTPFSQASNQLYYKTRPALTISKVNEVSGVMLDIERRRTQLSSSYEEEFLKESANAGYHLDEEGQDFDFFGKSIRRRANSLDHLPSPSESPAVLRKQLQYSPVETSGKPAFNRSVSLSQRSPFRKRIAFAEPETSLSTLRDQRPRSFKRHKNALEALFDAIERQDIEEIRKILQQPDIKINDVNADNFTPLDVALLKNEIEISQLLLLYGATENPAFVNAEVREAHLEALVVQADRKVNDLTASVVNCTSDVKESERQLREWEWRLYMLRIMQNTFLNTDIPSECPVVSTAPLSDQSIIIIITPGRHSRREIVTKYKIEWSTDETFEGVEGEQLVMDMRSLQYTIDGLEKAKPVFPKGSSRCCCKQGALFPNYYQQISWVAVGDARSGDLEGKQNLQSKKWYIQVRVGNMKGFGPVIKPDPPFVVPSSWHELNNTKPKYHGCKDRVAVLLDQIIDYKSTITDKSCSGTITKSFQTHSPSSSRESPKLGRKGSVFRTVSKYTNLVFHSAPKLLKRIKCRGIYLASLLYNEDDDRVLVTMDENLPVVEVDDNYSKSFSQEFYWLAKVSCTWEDVQQMLHDSSKVHSSHCVHIRRKLLQAGMVLQNATGTQDLGFLYFKAFKDSHGSILLLTINCVKKNLCGSRLTTMKWVPISRLQKKNNTLQDSIVPQRLIPSLQDQVSYHRRSKSAVARGLYLGYLKLRTAMDSLSIVVPEAHPNLLPHVKVKDIPNVTKEDWVWIQSLGTNQEPETETSLSCAAFESKIRNSAKKLFSNLGIEDEYANRHRIYNKEVIELNEDVLLILILPPVDDMCTNPGQSDLFHALSGYTSVPVQTFEMINTNTYQPEIMRSYARVSSILEMESFISSQTTREALSSGESKTAKERQGRVAEFQQSVDCCWRNARWVLDTIQFARDKNCNCGVLIGHLFDPDYVYTETVVSSPETKRNQIEAMQNSRNGVTTKHSSCMVKVHGTEEIGVLNNEFVEILVNKETTAKELVRLAAKGMLQYVREPNRDFFESSPDNANFLGLVVLCGSKERCLRDDLKLLSLQNPWEVGQVYLRLKREAHKAAKLSKSTSV